MTLRTTHSTAILGLSLGLLTFAATAQAPRYQSPINAPAPQTKLNLPTTPAITPNGEVVEDVVVRVNDQIISRSEVERSQEQLAQELQQTHASPTEAADREKNMLRDMIDQQLLLSRAKELGLNADAEVINQLNEIRKQNKLDSMEDLEKAARQQGVSFEDFKANIRNQILTRQVVRDEVGRRLQMSQAQEQAFYEAHKQEFTQPEQVRLSEILIPTASDANDAAIADAQAKATAIKAKLDAGASFDDLAKSSSGGPTAAKGGDLGEFKRGGGDLAKVLEDQTFVLKAGESTAPIRTRQGFVILKVTEHTAGGVPTLKEIEPQLQEAMYTDAMQPALRAYLTKLREEAYIDIKPGFIDAGASTKQTKPVFTAYTPPAVKKKTAAQKKRFDRGGRFSNAAASTPPAPPKVAAPVATPSPATEASTTPTATPVNPALTPVSTSTTGGQMAPITRRRKVRKEKIRYGQAPRTALPNEPDQTGLATDDGLGANHERRTAPTDVAPGTAIAPLQASTSADVNPLTPVPVSTGKTRFSARAKQEAAASDARKVAKVREKRASAAIPLTTDEKAAADTQAAPLGLSGDTVKKPKKVKVKGAPKERLQDQASKPPAPLPDETPSKAADRGTPLEGTAGAGRAKTKPDTIPLPGDDGPSTATPPGTTPTPTSPAAPGNPVPPATQPQ